MTADTIAAPGPAADRVARTPWPKAAAAYYTLGVLILSLTCAQLDLAIVPYLAGRMKADLHISDTQLSLLLGASFGLFYTVVGVPIAWFVDRYSRKWILAIAIAVWSIGTAFCGAAQNFTQLFLSRFLVGAGEAVCGPASYSITSDLFPREKMPRAIAILQIGSVLGPAVALLISFFVLKAFLDIPPIHVPFGVIHGWQLIFIIVGLPGVVVSILMLTTMTEPARHTISGQVEGGLSAGPTGFSSGLASWFRDFGLTLRYMAAHWQVYLPMFASLFVGSLGAGAAQWMPIFYQRTYGWGPAQLAGLSAIPAFTLMPLGLIIGVLMAEHFTRKGRDDAALRVQIISRLIALPGMFAVMMPNPWMAWGLSTLGMFSIGIGGPSQNAAIQIITPTELRGKITALFLFIYSVVGVAFSPLITALITDFILRDESQIRWAIFIPAVSFGPLSLLITVLGLKPYEREVKRLKDLEAARA